MNSSQTNPLLSLMTQSTLSTSRRLFLKSAQADISLSPFHKIWVIPPSLQESTKQHLLNIRNLNIYHLFPSLVADGAIEYTTSSTETTPTTIVVSRGDWDAYSLANYLTYSMSADSVKVTYDSGLLKFLFDPEIYIHYINEELGGLMGIPTSFKSSTYNDYALDRSIIPIKMCPIETIMVSTNLSINSIPQSNLVVKVPVDCHYGDLLQYEDYSAKNCALVMDHSIKAIEINLLDGEGKSLDSYLESTDSSLPSYESSYPGWSLTLEFTPVHNDGYEAS